MGGKLSEEMELLKSTSTIPEKNWKNRRSQKLEKMELLNLQSNLQSEIQAKQEVSQELSKVRSELEASRKWVFSYFLSYLEKFFLDPKEWVFMWYFLSYLEKFF